MSIKSEDLKPIKFQANSLLGGVLAKIYSEIDYETPIRMWGADIPNRKLILGDVEYTANTMRQVVDGVETAGIQLTVIDNSGANKVQSLYFFPIQQLRSVVLEVQGIQLA